MRNVIVRCVWFALLLVGCDSGHSPEHYLEQGQRHFDNGNWKSAVIEFKNVVKHEPSHLVGRTQLGMTYFSMGDFASAAKELDRALKIGADPQKVIQALAYSRLQLDEFDQALTVLNPEAVTGATEKASIYALRGQAFLNLNNMESAKEMLLKAKDLDENAPAVRLAWALLEWERGDDRAQRSWLEPLLAVGVADAWSQIGGLEMKNGNFVAAVDAYSKSLKAREYIHPDLMRRAMAYLQLEDYERAQEDVDSLASVGNNWIGIKHIAGLIALRTQNPDLARSHFQEVLSANPDYAPAQLPLAIIESRNNNLQSALSLLEQYTDLIPSNFDARIMLAEVLLKLDKLDKAQRLLQQLEDEHPKDSRVLVLLGQAYLKQGDSKQAVSFFRETIKLNPKDLPARMQLARALLSQSSTEQLGRRELEAVLEIDPLFLAADMELFKSYLQQQDFDKANLVAQAVKKKHPSKSNGGNLEALALLLSGKKDAALTQLSSLLEQFPRDILTSQNLAKIYMTDQRYLEAKDLYASVIEQDPSNLQVLSNLAAISSRLGNDEETMKWLTQAADRNPGALSPKLMLAAELTNRGMANKADQLLAPLETSHSRNAGFVLVMAQVKITLKEYQQALRLLSSVPNGVQVSLTAKMLRAMIYASTGDKKNLRGVLESIIELQPDNLQANIALTKLDLIEGHTQRFRERIRRLAEDYPSHPDVLWLSSKAASDSEDYNGAIIGLKELMQEKPSSSVAVELARNEWLQGRKDRAISGLEVWQDKNPDDVTIIYNLAQYYALDDRPKEALAAYRKLAKLIPDNPLVLNNLGWLLKEEDIATGLAMARKAVELDPNDATFQDTLAMLYLENGEIENALLYAKSAAQKMTGSDEIQLNYALVLVANNEKKLAERILSRLRSSATSPDIARKARVELARLQAE